MHPLDLLASTSASTPAIWDVLMVLVGIILVCCVLVSALETVVLPRNSFTRISRVTFAIVNRLLVHRGRNKDRWTHIRGLYAPVALVSLPLVWMISVIIGFTFIFWGVGTGSWTWCFEISGSSVTTLGVAKPDGASHAWISFVEAIIGLGLVALLISYLPTIYAAYHEREKGMRTLRPFSGVPATGVNLLNNLNNFAALDNTELWKNASGWLLELDQTHTAFSALCYFPESAPTQSWVASVAALLDAGALLLSAVPIDLSGGSPVPHEGAMVVLAHGVPALNAIGRAAGLPLEPPVPLLELVPDKSGGSPEISVTKDEYMAALDKLDGVLHVPADGREAAWLRFAAVRHSYDRAARGLAGLTLAAPAPWTTDRPAKVSRPRLVSTKPIAVDWSLTDR